MKWCSVVLFFVISFTHGQILRPESGGSISVTEEQRRFNDSINQLGKENRPSDSLQIYNPTIGDYNFWTDKLSKRQIDTAMTIDTFYHQNVYQKDLYSYQTFPNWGQTLNPLKPEQIDDNLQLLPIGKSWMYTKPQDVKYYDVKTPLTELVLENGVKEGQFLSTTFAHNIHSRWNYAINYKYLKSQGRYLNSLANSSNIIFSSNYQTKNARYKIKGNFVSHDLNNQENNGLTDESLLAFTQNNPNFSNRERMYVNTYYGQSKYDERRMHLDHQFGIFSFSRTTSDTIAQDTLQIQKEFPIYIKHEINYQHQAFEYNERSPDDYFNSALISDNRYNRKKFNKLENLVSLGYQWSNRLSVEGGLIQQMLKMYNDSTLTIDNLIIPESVTENRIGIQGNLKFDWRENIDIAANGFFTRGDKFGNQYQINANIRLIPFKNYLMQGGIKLNSSFPSLNYLMHQSYYQDFNYYNPGFKNQTTQEIWAELSSQQLGLTVYGSLLNQTNMVYVDTDYLPKQLDGATNYFHIGAREHFKYRSFGLDLQAQFQKVIQNADYLPLPDLITRATAYYQTRAFKNHAHIQTGITAHYYSKFNSREFFPIINEFMISQPENARNIGNYPQIDAFFNMKVDRMRIYLRSLNLNSFIQPGKYFSTPLQPDRDFKIQVGIHWFLFS